MTAVNSNIIIQASSSKPMAGPSWPQQRAERPRVLVSDDQHDILTALELLLKLNGYQTQRADSPAGLLSLTRTGPFDLILMDLNYTRDTTSGQEGLELLTELRKTHSACPIVVMTAWGNVELAVEAMRLGASDFVQKPWDNSRLLQTLSKQLDRTAEARQAEARSRSELEIARHVQQKLFPQRLKLVRTLDYAGQCLPARVVGGDYYDFFDTGDERLAFVLADVSGKGVAAAMLMANLQACFRTQLEAGVRNPIDLLRTANRLFYDSTPDSQYVTLFYGEYDEASSTIQFSNCGHLSPVLVRNGGTVERLEPTGTVLGLFSECAIGVQSVQFGTGDLLVAFTDGITEATLADGSEFGEERVVAAALKADRAAAAEWVSNLLALSESSDSANAVMDDRTVIAFSRR